MTGPFQSPAPNQSKVWIVAPSPPPYGGMSVQGEKLRRKLLAEGIDAELIPTNPSLPWPWVKLARIPILRTMLREMQYLVSLIRVLRNPGVVHHFSASFLYFFLHSAPLLLMSKWCGAKIVLNYRGGRAAEFFQKWPWAVLPLLRKADRIVVPSEFLRQVFWNLGLAATVLPNLADTELFPFVPRKQFLPRLFVSRNLEPMYDVECVMQAFRIVQAKLPHATLGIAGEGSESSRLRALAEKWCLQGVNFYGAVRHEELPSLYEQYDIYINASRVDNFPGALVEAACSGLPIVTTRAGGIPEMIRHRENGLLCELGDANALAHCVLEMVEDQEFARQLAERAHLWAEQFSWRNIFPELLRCYGFDGTREALALAVDQVPVH